MNATLEQKISKAKTTKRLIITLSVSTPIIFWIVGLLG